MGGVLVGTLGAAILYYFILNTWGPGGGEPHGLFGFIAILAAYFLVPARLAAELILPYDATFLLDITFGWVQCVVVGSFVFAFCRWFVRRWREA